MPCKHAELMMIYANKQAAEMDDQWKLWGLY